MNCERPLFATLPTKEFVNYLESNGIEPTEEERGSLPMGSAIAMREGIEHSILQVTGQRYGWSVVESTAKQSGL